MTDQERIRLKSIVGRHDRFRNSYFWSPPGSACNRRYMEKQNSDEIHFEHDNRKYDIVQEVRCSCRNVYYSMSIKVDGQKKNIRALRAII